MQCSTRPRVPPLDLSATRHEHYQHNADPWGARVEEMGPDKLPIDPRNWTRADVTYWLELVAAKENLTTKDSKSSLSLSQRFPMNGKALCLMSEDMYLCRVPSGGEILFQDFRMRLYKAIYQR